MRFDGPALLHVLFASSRYLTVNGPRASRPTSNQPGVHRSKRERHPTGWPNRGVPRPPTTIPTNKTEHRDSTITQPTNQHYPTTPNPPAPRESASSAESGRFSTPHGMRVPQHVLTQVVSCLQNTNPGWGASRTGPLAWLQAPRPQNQEVDEDVPWHPPQRIIGPKGRNGRLRSGMGYLSGQNPL